MKILILGSEGFIGAALVGYYIKSGATVFGGDIVQTGGTGYSYVKVSRLSPEFDQLLQADRFDVCINAAGSGNVPYSMDHPVGDFEANALDTIRILDGLKRFQPDCKYVHISSAAVYGNPVTLPVRENDELNPISPYGWHKLIAENICKEYSKIFKVQLAIVRPFSVFGVGLKKQLFWDLYQKCLGAGANNAIQLWGSGNESRDFIYIDDLVRAFDCVVQRGEFGGEVYNVASGTETTVQRAVVDFVTHFDQHIKIQFNKENRVGDPQNWNADIGKLRNLGFTESLTFSEGIIKTVSWMRSLK